MIRCLKLQTGAEIHFLSKAKFADTVIANPYLHKVWTIQKQISEVTDALQAEQFDLVVDLHNNLRTADLRRRLKRPQHAFPKLNFEKWLLVNTGINRLPDIHIVHRYFKATATTGIQYDGKGLDFFIPEDSEVNPSDINADLLPERYIAVAIGAAHATKRIPIDKIIEVCRGIETPIALLGGSEDRTVGEQIAKTAGSHVCNLAGSLSLLQSASMVRQSKVVVTPDTGMMHIAAAFSKPIVSVWGNTIPGFGMTPFYPDGVAGRGIILEVKGLKCRPCSKIGKDTCPREHFRCMKDITASDIISAVSTLI